MKKLITQILRFGIVGILCFFVDYALMILLTEMFHINYLISSGISFSISVIINYILSMLFVFQGKKDQNKFLELIIFVILSVIGLGINQLVMWMAVEKIGIHYMISKMGVTAIVMVYNFITRKIIIEGR